MSFSHAQLIYKAAIAAVSPPLLVARAVNFIPQSSTLRIGEHSYKLNRNVKVVGFGKAVLGMAAAVEKLLGEHITTGMISVPKGILETAAEKFPQHLLSDRSKIRVFEGAENNQPDEAAHRVARAVLSLLQEAEEDDIVMVLISGGGSALLPCPVDGVSLKEKAQAIKLLSQAGATINELNTFRKLISQTKGGKLAEAAYPAKVVSLVLSDVVNDPLDIIASGPTVPNTATKRQVLKIVERYSLEHKIPSSILSHLQDEEVATHHQCPISGGCYAHVQNVVIGSNRTATQAACSVAEGLGYTTHAWSHRIQGEARHLATMYVKLAQVLSSTDQETADQLLGEEEVKGLLSSNPALQEDLEALLRRRKDLGPPPLCLVSAGEPTVTVHEGSSGTGGRSQELALAFAMSLSCERFSKSCILASVGTDGQDGPRCDAAGAMVDTETAKEAEEDGLRPESFLKNNDSHTFFSRLKSGKCLIKTGLTGTNVMDIHILLVK